MLSASSLSTIITRDRRVADHPARRGRSRRRIAGRRRLDHRLHRGEAGGAAGGDRAGCGVAPGAGRAGRPFLQRHHRAVRSRVGDHDQGRPVVVRRDVVEDGDIEEAAGGAGVHLAGGAARGDAAAEAADLVVRRRSHEPLAGRVVRLARHRPQRRSASVSAAPAGGVSQAAERGSARPGAAVGADRGFAGGATAPNPERRRDDPDRFSRPEILLRKTEAAKSARFFVEKFAPTCRRCKSEGRATSRARAKGSKRRVK